MLCSWLENRWKYDELLRLIRYERARYGGFDLNRLSSLDLNDFIKIGILRKYMRE